MDIGSNIKSIESDQKTELDFLFILFLVRVCRNICSLYEIQHKNHILFIFYNMNNRHQSTCHPDVRRDALHKNEII